MTRCMVGSLSNVNRCFWRDVLASKPAVVALRRWGACLRVAVIGIVAVACSASVAVAADMGSLAETAGLVVHVSNSQELKSAIENAADGTTIMIADGLYEPKRMIYLREGKDITIRGASGNPEACVIRGRGFDVGTTSDDILRLGGVDNITIAHLTFEECRAYAVKVEGEFFPRNVHFYNCRFRNIGVRAIKGTASQEARVEGGSIRYCHFENDRVPPADWPFDGNYITAIDMMALDGWTISDNTFRNIRGRTGSARGAIFVWVRSKNIIVERNFIFNCDRGISFGNPSGSTASADKTPHVSDSIIRNNIIVPGPDAAIELWWAHNVRIYHNTIWRHDVSGRGIRGGTVAEWPISEIDIANNLIRGTNDLPAEGVALRSNIIGTLEGFFVNAPGGEAAGE